MKNQPKSYKQTRANTHTHDEKGGSDHKRKFPPLAHLKLYFPTIISRSKPWSKKLADSDHIGIGQHQDRIGSI